MNQLTKKENTELQTTGGYASAIQLAVEKDFDVAKLEKLMELQERWEKNEARKAYFLAMAEFMKDPPKIIKDLINKQYNSPYVSAPNLINTANEGASKHGLFARFDFSKDEGEQIVVSCIMSHVLGHSESVTLSGPPDGSGSKNPLQQRKSTITYLEKATFEGITGIMSQDTDDDGNTADLEYITESQAIDINSLIDEVKADRSKFLKYLGVESVEIIPVKLYGKATKALEAKRRQA